MVPNDEEERERLDIMHEQMLTMMDGKLFLAPLKAPQSALDLGTGTGIWAVDFGKTSRSKLLLPFKYNWRLTDISRSQ